MIEEMIGTKMTKTKFEMSTVIEETQDLFELLSKLSRNRHYLTVALLERYGSFW